MTAPKTTAPNDVFSALAVEKVRGRNGEELGKVEDFVLDIDSGRVAYAVVSFGGTLGVGDRLFAVPPEALARDAGDGFVLDAERSTLARAPAFDRGDWPDFGDRTLGADIYSFYGRTPYWA